MISGNNFICFVEIKLGAPEGKDQTPKYYKEGMRMANKEKMPLFIYLTLTGETAYCNRKYNENIWKSVKWSEVIKKVLKPLYDEAEEEIKKVLHMVIYSLQYKENPELVGFFDKKDEYRKDKVVYYLILKELNKKTQNGGKAMKKLSPEVLTYLKNCSAVEIARDEFINQMGDRLGLKLQQKHLTIEKEWIRLGKENLQFYFRANGQKVEFGISVQPIEREQERVKSKLKKLGEPKQENGKWIGVYKKCPTNKFDNEVKAFCNVFKDLK